MEIHLKIKDVVGQDEKEVAVLEAYIRSKDWSESHIDRALGIVDELVNKAKSLRPQKHWKPSEEQLRELHCVISGCSYETPVLVELEKQLMNLL